MTAITAGWSSFKKEMFSSGFEDARGWPFDTFGQVDYRLARYRFFWACYENTVYDDVHRWAHVYKADYALYKNTRGCYNPFFRLGEFWGNHVWGGHLDPLKQAGRIEPSGLPIMTANDAIREPIGQLWKDSNWESNKTIVPRLGAVKGDVAIRVDDDILAGKVRLQPVDAATITWVDCDCQGNIQGYIIQEPRWDPNFDPQKATQFDVAYTVRRVLYTERCSREGDTITFETFKDNIAYPWNGRAAKWSVDYGFVPLVLINHMRVIPDYSWGWSEYQGALTKAREADHTASNLHSQIRKASDPRFLMAGVQAPSKNLAVQGATPSRGNPQPGDAEVAFVYGGIGATAVPLLFPLDVQFTSMEIQNQVASLEKDYPELRYDSARIAGDASAKALREVRKTAEAKVHARRVGYDNALVRAQMMALSIGGFRGYKGYEAFDLGSFDAGKLDHSIGERTVFLLDPLDRIEEETAFWAGANQAKAAGVPLIVYLERAGWAPAEIDAFNKAKADEQQQAVAQAQAMTAAMAPPQPTNQPASNGKVPA